MIASPRSPRPPWLAGALLLGLVAAVVVPLVSYLGAQARLPLGLRPIASWAWAGGLVAIALLLFGTLERLWQSLLGLRYRRSLASTRAAAKGRFKVVAGGRTKEKGNGHARDAGEGPDGPGWLM